jgi:hypothetical protein
MSCRRFSRPNISFVLTYKPDRIGQARPEDHPRRLRPSWRSVSESFCLKENLSRRLAAAMKCCDERFGNALGSWSRRCSVDSISLSERPNATLTTVVSLLHFEVAS